MNRFFVLYTSIVLMGLSLPSPSFAQESYQNLVFLKNGNIIRGYILELIPNQVIKIRLRDGEIESLSMQEVEKITSNISELNWDTQPPLQLESRMQLQFDLQRAQRKKTVGLLGAGTVWGLTILGDIAAGGPFYTGSAIPSIGPLIAIVEVIDDPNGRSIDIVLFTLSGVAQNLGIREFILGSRRERSILNQLQLTAIGTSQSHSLTLTYRF